MSAFENIREKQTPPAKKKGKGKRFIHSLALTERKSNQEGVFHSRAGGKGLGLEGRKRGIKGGGGGKRNSKKSFTGGKGVLSPKKKKKRVGRLTDTKRGGGGGLYRETNQNQSVRIPRKGKSGHKKPLPEGDLRTPPTEGGERMFTNCETGQFCGGGRYLSIKGNEGEPMRSRRSATHRREGKKPRFLK